MPITFRTSSKKPVNVFRHKDQPTLTADTLLQQSCHDEHKRSKQILQSSFLDIEDTCIRSHRNGFVGAAVYAYSNHHNLTLRPEDIWFSILTQLSFYINAHAESLRSSFVSHDGKKEVEAMAIGSLQTVNMGLLAVKLTKLMEKHIVDTGLRKWIMPDFSTTTETDRITAAVLMMGSMQKYFSFAMLLRCGIPSVMLLGSQDDWIKIRDRLDKFKQWGEEPALFADRLTTVLDYFVKSFDEPGSAAVQGFWSKIAHHVGGGSGPTYLSGWITAFCFWDAEGKRISTTRAEFVDEPVCRIGETTFSLVDSEDVPAGYASVPVKVDDNGTMYETRMVAGSVGYEAVSIDGARNTRSGAELDTVQPLSGWWMYEVNDGESNNSASIWPLIRI